MNLTKENSANVPGSKYDREFFEQLPLGIMILNKELKIEYFNRNMELFGILSRESEIPDEVYGAKVLHELLRDNELSRIQSGEAIEKIVKSSQAVDKSEINIVLKCAPLTTEGSFSGAVLILEDIKVPETVHSRNRRYFENSFEGILNKIWSLFLLVSPEGKILLRGGQKTKHFSTGSAGIDSVYDYFLPRFSERIITSFRGAMLKRQSEEIILDMPSEEEDEDTQYFECSVAPVAGERLKIQFVFISIREITIFLKMIENYKRELTELQQYYNFTQNSSEAVVVINRDGRIVFWNKGSESVFKLRRSEVFGKHVLKIFNTLDDAKLTEIFEAGSAVFDELIILQGGEKRYLSCRAEVSTETGAQPSCALFILDKTDSAKRIEEARLLLNRYESFFRDNNQGAVLLNSDGRILLMNRSFQQATGIRDGSQQPMYFLDLVQSEAVVKFDLSFRKMAENYENNFDLLFKLKDNRQKWFSCQLIPMTEGKEIRYIAQLSDIDEVRQTVDELKLLRSVFDYSNDGIAVESEGVFILVNTAFLKLYGYSTREELIGTDILTIVADEEVARIQDYSRKRLLGKEVPVNYDFVAKRKDNSKFFAEVSVTPFDFNGQNYFVIVARDVTERKHAQQLIKESEERYRSITENIDDFFWTAERVNERVKSMFYTASVEKVTGYSSADLLSDNKFFFRLIHPDDFPVVKERLKRFYNNYYKRSDELEFRIISRGGNIVWIRNKINVLRDRKGKLLKIFGLVSDITMRKKAEEELKQSSANLQKLNETKDKFISIISHDLRTPFSSIMGFTDLLLSEEEMSAVEARQYVKYIQESAQNMLSLVNSLLDWTRIQTGRVNFEPRHINFQDFIQSVLSGLSGVAMSKGVTLLSEIDAEAMLFVDHNLTLQIFNNLLSNALKFTPSGGSITVSGRQSSHPRFIEIAVKDTGMGIKDENMGKIFNVDAKFTTEGTAGEKGTGLGLSLVKEIVEKHGGKIWVESVYQSGTTFFLTLPKASATILIVDDSNTDRLLYSKIIKSMVFDYEIMTAKNGKEALEIIKQTSFALIITDHSMPVMNGLQFVEEFKKLKIAGKPPVMVLSGDIGKSEQLMYADLGIEYVFNKPVNLVSFKAAIEKCLKQLPR